MANIKRQNIFDGQELGMPEDSKNKSEETNRKPFYKQVWFWVIVFIVFAIGLGIWLNNDNMVTIENSEHSNDQHDDNQRVGVLYSNDHPILYDDGKKANEYANSHNGVETSSRYFKTGETELAFSIYGPVTEPKNTVLHEIEMYPKEELSLDDAMNLAKTFLPMKVLSEHYQQSWSHKYCTRSDGTQPYAQLYVPTVEGKEWIKENDLPYNYALIVVYMKDGKAESIILRSTNSVPNMGSKCDTQNWEYSII